MLIKASQLHKKFNQTPVLRGLDLNIPEGSHVALQGASGSGKSTLLYMLGGLDRPDSGEIWVQGRNILKLSDEDLAQFRNQFIGFVFQFHFLLNSMDCRNNVLLPAKIGGQDISNVEKFVTQLAEQLGVTHCFEKYPHQLSGGEQQRINLIRALSLKPKLLLCDEPTGNLDSKNSSLVMKLLKDLSSTYGATLLVVTHDDRLAHDFPLKLTI